MKIRRRFSNGGLPTLKWITGITGKNGSGGDGFSTLHGQNMWQLHFKEGL